MTDKQEAAIGQIVSHYTYDQQREQFVEECAEAVLAVQKCKRGKKGAFENLKEEVADVLIMAEQMRQYIGAETVDKIINAKLQRQLNRIMAEGMTKT